MGFFNDLGSLLGDAADLKSDVLGIVEEVTDTVKDTTAEIIDLKDSLSVVPEQTIDVASDAVNGITSE